VRNFRVFNGHKEKLLIVHGVLPERRSIRINGM